MTAKEEQTTKIRETDYQGKSVPPKGIVAD